MGEPTAAFDSASAVSPWALINSSTTEDVLGEAFSPEEEGGGEANAKKPGLASSVSLAWMNWPGFEYPAASGPISILIRCSN